MRRPRQTLAAALLLPLLAGCGGAPQASAPPSLAPSITSSGATTTPSPTEQPLSKGGAKRFVQDYIESLNVATTTGDLTQVEKLDDGTCESCRATLGAIREIYDAGGSVEGGQWTPTVLQALRRDNGWVVDVRIDFAPQSVARATDDEPEEFEGGKGLASFIVRAVDGRWLVDEWTRAN